MQYDLTGIDPAYLVTDKLFVVFEPSQLIELGEPVFSAGLSVIKHTDAGNVPLVLGTDYIIREQDNDDAAISEAKVIDSTFDKRLIKSIIMPNTFTDEYEIAVTFQKFRSTLVDDAYREGIPTEYDASLMGEVVTTLRYLEAMAVRRGDELSLNTIAVDPLDEDLTGIKPENFIEDERHDLDTSNNKRVIRPAHGAFYAHEVVVKSAVDPATILVEGTDFIIIGADLPRTRVCDHPSGVFNYIYITTSFIGEVDITYHAFGGMLTNIDINSIRDALMRILLFLQDQNYITSGALPYHPYMKSINGRLIVAEDWLRGLDSSIPNISFMINPGNEFMHWYSFATMYQRDNDQPAGYVYYKNSGRFCLKMKGLGLEMYFTISVNKERVNDPFDVNIDITNMNGEKVAIDGYKELADLVIPRVRMITGDDMDTGMTLQLGVALRGLVSDDVIIENHSGKECEWYLIDDPNPTRPPMDDNVVLPDGTTTWIQGGASMQEYQTPIGSDDGVLIWAGAKMLHDILYPNSIKMLTLLNTVDVVPEEVTSLSFTVLDRATGKISTVTSGDDSYPPQFAVTVNDLDFVIVIATVGENAGQLELDTYATMGKHSEVNERYCLLQVIANFNK